MRHAIGYLMAFCRKLTFYSEIHRAPCDSGARDIFKTASKELRPAIAFPVPRFESHAKPHHVKPHLG
jgi:hypothetical protein